MNVSAILTSDLHLREDTPVCRTDDFQKTLARKLDWLRELQHKHGDVPILDAGDLFHHWKPSPALLSWAMRRLPEPFITVPGNHDMPQHNLGMLELSGLNVLRLSKDISLLPGSVAIRSAEFLESHNIDMGFDVYGIPWGRQALEGDNPLRIGVPTVLLYHGGVYVGQPPYPGAEVDGFRASTMLDRFPQFDLIVSGHYHTGFTLANFSTKTGEPRLLVNPGGIARMTADEIDRQPYVYLWDAERNVVTPVAVPIEQGVVRRDHIIQQEERSGRMDAFLSRMSQDVEIQLSFRENLKRHMVQNDISKSVQEEVWQCLEMLL